VTQARTRWNGEHLRYDVPHVRLRQVAEIVRTKSPKRVLDVGCATGHLRRLLPQVEYVGCDFASPAQPPDFEFHLCDLNREGLPGHLTGFDVVVCSGILEYVNALPATFRDIGLRLRPSGSFVCTYFNDQHAWRRLSRVLGHEPYRHPDWTTLLPLAALHEQLRAAGLPVRRTFASTLGIGPAPAVAATVGRRSDLAPLTGWTQWLAHQFVIDCGR
jgi:SAM-dependent methyltransferase